MTFSWDLTENDKLFFIDRLTDRVVKKEVNYTAEGKLITAGRAAEPACVISLWKKKKGGFPNLIGADGRPTSKRNDSVRCDKCSRNDVCIRVEEVVGLGTRFAISKRV